MEGLVSSTKETSFLRYSGQGLLFRLIAATAASKNPVVVQEKDLMQVVVALRVIWPHWRVAESATAYLQEEDQKMYVVVELYWLQLQQQRG